MINFINKILSFLYHVIFRDLWAFYGMFIVRSKLFYYNIFNVTIGALLEKMAFHKPNKTIYIDGDRHLTFQQFNRYTNQVANAFYEQGFQPGDEIALFMESTPEYNGIWIGLSKIGVITALVNPNLKLHSLSHSINILNAKAIIYHENLSESVQGALPFIEKAHCMRLYVYGEQDGYESVGITSIRFEPLIASASPHKVLSPHKPKIKDTCFYAYTSGTTGLPKAVAIRQLRIVYFTTVIEYLGEFKTEDINYVPLPLYHMIGVVGTMIPIFRGCTSVIRHKFSVSKYWDEFEQNKCTTAFFIGELCRFLLSGASKGTYTRRQVRLAVTSGLDKAVWTDFVDRFNVKRILEFYASTEGSANMINPMGKVGAIGFLPKIFPNCLVQLLYPVIIIKVDAETNDPIRGPDGLCQIVGPDDIGALVAKIKDNDILFRFDGYHDEEETRKKILTNVLVNGDHYFISGDLVTIDKYGYVYFKDRIGDTYRWRGENVSTKEIETAAARFCNNSNAAVFGVEIPGNEGKVGMLALVDNTASIDLNKLLEYLRSIYPLYALPHFIRFVNELQYTHTGKVLKVNLKRQGYNVNMIKDPIYYLDTKAMIYKRLNTNTYEDIINHRYQF